MISTKITLQKYGISSFTPKRMPQNDNKKPFIKTLRVADVDVRIAAHESFIKTLLLEAEECHDSKIRERLAKQIGYSLIEIECCLKPLKEKIDK